MLSIAIPFPLDMIFHVHIFEPNSITGVCLFDLLALIKCFIAFFFFNFMFCYGNDMFPPLPPFYRIYQTFERAFSSRSCCLHASYLWQ